MSEVRIDPEKLRDAVRKLGDDYVFYMLDDAISLLSPTKLEKLAGQYLDVKRLRPDAEPTGGERTLLALVKTFDARSRAGGYYESFNVDSKNCTDSSPGTRSFIAECRRLLDRCVAETRKGDPVETRASFETIFNLLRHIDDAHDDVIFFADEGESWQVGVEWRKVFPAWFRCLSRTAPPDDFGRLVVDTVNALDGRGDLRHIASARKLASPEQRRALDAVLDRRKLRHP